VPLAGLDPGRDWRLRRLRIHGTDAVSARKLRQVMVTQPRPWYAIWRRRPPFDPIAFGADLERIKHLYRSRGYYHAVILHDIELPEDGDVVVAEVSVDEGPVVNVERVDVALSGAELPSDQRQLLVHGLPIAAAEPFTEDAYNRAAAQLRAYYREHGYARVRVTKHGTVDVLRDTAVVTYSVESGPACVFGDVRIEGTEKVDASVVRREVAFRPNAPFQESLLDRTRGNLRALKLFQSVEIDEETTGKRVDIRIRLQEQAPREVRLGVGFDTEELLRGTAGWRHYNFLGGARQLGFTARASFLQRAIAADFLQPHFPVADSRTTVVFGQFQLDDVTFTLDQTRVSPRIDWQVTPALAVFVFHRLEYDSLSDVDDDVANALPEAVESDGILSGLAVGVEWNGTDDQRNPTRGFATSAIVEPVGGLLGGDFDFVRLTWEGRAYQRLIGRLVGAARLRLGAADPVGSSDEIPLFERFYSGGINSVRGYGRWRIGPRADDDPLGGRTLVEASIELRHPITDAFTGAVFLDAGQVSLRSYDFPFDDLRYGAGLGMRYHSPVGPISFDLGFPFQPPGDDEPWQVHVGLGSTF
jgi:outer membrane protein assembly complex protein YaeT